MKYSIPNVYSLNNSGYTNKEVLQLIQQVYLSKKTSDRLDKLIELYQYTQRLEDKTSQEIHLSAGSFIKVICNTDDIDGAIGKRLTYKSIDPFYIPGISNLEFVSASSFTDRISYLRSRMKDVFYKMPKRLLFVSETLQKQDHTLGVARFSDEESEKYRVFLSQGFLWTFKNSGQDEALELVPFDTTNMVAHGAKNRAIFVVNARYEIFSCSGYIGKLHHSSILGGKPVVCAGKFTVSEGELIYINEDSGHYVPGIYQFFKFLRYLKSMDCISNNTTIDYVQSSKKGIKVSGEGRLNTLGFLSPSENKPVMRSDQNQMIHYGNFSALMNLLDDHGQFEEDEPLFNSFRVVMTGYLETYPGENELIRITLQDLQDLPANEAGSESTDIEEHIQALVDFIDEKGDPDQLKSDWLLEYAEEYANTTIHLGH